METVYIHLVFTKILSLKDVVFRTLFLALFPSIVGW